MPSDPRPPRRTVLPVIAAVALTTASLLVLSGCRTDVGPSGLPGTTSTSTAEPLTSASSSPLNTPVPDPSSPSSPPLDAACEDLVPLDALYAVNPNFALVPAPDAEGEPFTQLLAKGGLACGVTHATTGSIALIVVAEPDAQLLESLRAAAGSLTSEADGTEFYGDDTLAQAFDGTRWYAILGEPDGAIQATALLSAVLGG